MSTYSIANNSDINHEKVSIPSHDEYNPNEYTGTASDKHSEDDNELVGTITSVDDYIIIGKQKFLKDELVTAFGGTLNPERYGKLPVRNLGNPAPMGLCAFAVTTFLLSIINTRAMGVDIPNIVVSSAFFYGGLVQFLSGVWEIALGNTFGGTALTSFGAFWASFGAIHVDGFNITSAYADPVELGNATGFFLLGWAIFTFMLLLCTTKSTYAFCGLFSILLVTFILLTVGSFTGNPRVNRAGGVAGIITSMFGFYNAFAGIANRNNCYIRARPGFLPGYSALVSR